MEFRENTTWKELNAHQQHLSLRKFQIWAVKKRSAEPAHTYTRNYCRNMKYGWFVNKFTNSLLTSPNISQKTSIWENYESTGETWATRRTLGQQNFTGLHYCLTLFDSHNTQQTITILLKIMSWPSLIRKTDITENQAWNLVLPTKSAYQAVELTDTGHKPLVTTANFIFKMTG